MFVKYILIFSDSTHSIFVEGCIEGDFLNIVKLPEWYRTNLTVWSTWIPPGFLYLTEIYVRRRKSVIKIVIHKLKECCLLGVHVFNTSLIYNVYMNIYIYIKRKEYKKKNGGGGGAMSCIICVLGPLELF